MAYFSNGTEGDIYREAFCARCIHDREDKMCPVWEIHFDFAYELCNAYGTPGKHMLDRLIPMDGRHYPAQCAMFYPRDRIACGLCKKAKSECCCSEF